MEMSGAWQTERACLFHSSYRIAERMDCEMAIKEWIKGDTKNRIKIPKHYQVVIYNDDFTPMDFVVKVLMQVFDKEEQEATAIMMRIPQGYCQHQGRGSDADGASGGIPSQGGGSLRPLKLAQVYENDGQR